MKRIETGRSMVEMLGVLAIIGVLSVGGISGYSRAMSKYRANEIMNAVSLANVELQLGGTPDLHSVPGASLAVSGSFVVVTVEDSTVCKAIKEAVGDLWIAEGNCE